MTEGLPTNSIFVLLNPKTSRPNKLALVADYQNRGFYVDWRWKGEPLRSRLCFRFSRVDRWFEASSYEEDIAPLLKERLGGST